MSEVTEKAKAAREASRVLAVAGTEKKNEVLGKMAEALVANADSIIRENERDICAGAKAGTGSTMLDRLSLNIDRIKSIAEGLIVVRNLPDPVGEITAGWVRPNGLKIARKRVPLGVIAIIYEARPNVTVDAAGLCLKSGNAVILRGSSSAINSNKAIVKLLQKVLVDCGLPAQCVQLIEDTNRDAATELMRQNGYVDVIIPRGGAGLIKNVVENATVPVIETGVGNCHVYVDRDADLAKAIEITYNSKVQRPSVCNAAESLLIHADIADKFVPEMFAMLRKAGVVIRGCEETRKLDKAVELATEEDYYTEFLDLIISVKIVSDVEEAIEHIAKYSSRHTEAIVTENITTANKFTDNVDSAAVIINASTRFTDGGEFGFGAEIGISTQKIHARGPMGLTELTTIKYIVEGSGQIR